MSKEVKYKQRIADYMLRRRLEGKGAILIEGPKWCGKTTTAKQVAGSILNLGDITVLKEAQQDFQIQPKKLLEGDTPRLIDEWQTMTPLWDMVRSEVDERQGEGHFILTGSSVPPEQDSLIHSGTGRIGRLKMRTMSLWESEESSGSVSLNDLFNGVDFGTPSNDINIEQLAFLICRGGWPKSTLLRKNASLDEAFDYFDAIYNVDIHRVDNIRRSSERARLLLRSYARNQGSSISFEKMNAEIIDNDNKSISSETISDYVGALRKIFVIEDMPAWNPNLRSKIAIQSTDTRYFTDPSIATAALGISPDDLLNDLCSFGLFFETMAVRDLRTYADAMDGKIFHYRDSKGLECDAVLHRRNGSYALIEIKLGGLDDIEKAAATLKKMADKIDTTKMPQPSFMMVLTGVGSYAYRRPDGVLVVPIGCLKD